MTKKAIGKEKKKVIKKKKEFSDEYLKYKSYIRSKEWKKVQEWFYTNVYKKRCYCCGRVEGEDNCTIALHHSDYSHLYNEKETPECLIPICNICHYAIHRARSNWKRFKLDKENEEDNNEEKIKKNVVKHKKISKKD